MAGKNEIMTKEGLIKKNVETLERLPEDRIQEIADFAYFVHKKYEDQILQKGIETIVSESNSFALLFFIMKRICMMRVILRKSIDAERRYRLNSFSFH